MYISELHEKNSVNGVISKITEDFEKTVAVTKLKELKQYLINILPITKNEKNKKFSKQLLTLSIKNKMKPYCLKCKKDTENLDSKMFRTKNNRLIMQLKCSYCENKKSRFMKEQEAKGLLSNL